MYFTQAAIGSKISLDFRYFFVAVCSLVWY